ncbi:hypothetical protein CFC21_000745 [Triticum aestivum]|uniref:Restorer of fertility-like protein n=1 Tax=Triticum aestivum TaxID=4565 RepID=A0A3B5XW27_WHEAT|nr:hypothetical protein CFC21_000745 [Triticum aestivum]QIP66331.1 restorer of fertility-like protein [Triticum aestivum]QIP66412.1 restorer of fertility-like protein [Triticum aestivum]QIP66521.1 restorer of fertility-like protein [Triticum aestivum]QIP66642.1 restorer of fertility-like protein [Triticum aestivum]
MPRRLYSTRPMSYTRLCRRLSSSSTTTSSSSPSWCPHAAFATATERVRAGTLSPEHVHHLFDKLLRQATPVPERSLNGFLAALAHAPDSSACKDGPALVLAIFNRVSREEAGLRVATPAICTYCILMDCCCRARRRDLGLAFFGRLVRTGLKTNQIAANNLLKCLCHAKRTDEAVSVLLHRMSDLGCAPNCILYNTVLKSLCEDSRSQQALDLLQMMAKEGGVCSPSLVKYNTVIHGFFKEGQVSKACNLYHEMMSKGLCLMW